MYGAVITPSNDADFDVFFLHNEGYSTMCGHAIIALTKLVIEAGLIRKDRVSFNVPSGGASSPRAMIEDPPGRTDPPFATSLHTCIVGISRSRLRISAR